MTLLYQPEVRRSRGEGERLDLLLYFQLIIWSLFPGYPNSYSYDTYLTRHSWELKAFKGAVYVTGGDLTFLLYWDPKISLTGTSMIYVLSFENCYVRDKSHNTDWCYMLKKEKRTDAKDSKADTNDRM